ncbi:hypothetical protein [Kitasatospora cineracea]|uniref:hypothetical protein n=1 Tax=Kitasatospora cineracea TaxID=88074 RepID=UPI00381BEF67
MPTNALHFHDIEFHPVVVTATTEHLASRRVLANPLLRIARADEVRTGDLIVSAFDPQLTGRMPRTGFLASGPYPAEPTAFDPACGCGVCDLPEVQGPNGIVVLTIGWPWDACDPWPVDEPVLVLPRLRLFPRTRPNGTG